MYDDKNRSSTKELKELKKKLREQLENQL